MCGVEALLVEFDLLCDVVEKPLSSESLLTCMYIVNKQSVCASCDCNFVLVLVCKQSKMQQKIEAC